MLGTLYTLSHLNLTTTLEGKEYPQFTVKKAEMQRGEAITNNWQNQEFKPKLHSLQSSMLSHFTSSDSVSKSY